MTQSPDESTSANRWVESLFSSIDRQDEQRFASFLTEDASFRFGNAPAVSGRKEAGEAVADFFSSIEALSHEILGVWRSDETVVCELAVTYTRRDGERLTLPAATIFSMREGLIEDYKIFADISPLYI